MSGMLKKNEYRFCVRVSLQILQKEREKLCYDSTKHNPTIYSGLHEFESESLRKLYFQAYLVDWIDAHWDTMDEILDRHREYSVNERRCMNVFFAEYFSKLISECDSGGVLSKLAIPDLLKTKRKALANMIDTSDKWQENSARLKAERKKHREQFARLIEEYENESE